MPAGEPTSDAEVAAWVAERQPDRFARIRAASDEHREAHGCSVHPTRLGPLLGVLAAARGAARVLEVGTGLGYSALWLAYGSGGHVTTIEADPDHARLARETAEAEGFDGRIEILEGDAEAVLDGLEEPFDLCFFDADPDAALVCLPHFVRLTEPGALLVSANLFLGRHDPGLPGLDATAAYRDRLLEDPRLLTAFLPSGLALSVRGD